MTVCLLRYRVKYHIGGLHYTRRTDMELNRVVGRKDRMPLLKKLNTDLAMASHKEEITGQCKF